MDVALLLLRHWRVALAVVRLKAVLACLAARGIKVDVPPLRILHFLDDASVVCRAAGVYRLWVAAALVIPSPTLLDLWERALIWKRARALQL